MCVCLQVHIHGFACFDQSMLQPNAVRDAGIFTSHILPQKSRAVSHGNPAVTIARIKVLGPGGVERGGSVQILPGRTNHDVHGAAPRGVTQLPVHGAGPLVAVVVTPQGQVHPVLVEEVLQCLLHHQGDHEVAGVLLARVHRTVSHEDEPGGGALVHTLEVALEPLVLGGASGEVVFRAHHGEVHHPIVEAVPPRLVAMFWHVEAVVERNAALSSRVDAIATPPWVESATSIVLLVVPDADHIRCFG